MKEKGSEVKKKVEKKVEKIGKGQMRLTDMFWRSWSWLYYIFLKNNDQNGFGKTPKSQIIHQATRIPSGSSFPINQRYGQLSRLLLIQRPDLNIEVPSDVPTAIERVNLIKSVIAYLLDASPVCESSAPKNSNSDPDNIFSCGDCETYEKNLQKLEGEVRNHIRVKIALFRPISNSDCTKTGSKRKSKSWRKRRNRLIRSMRVSKKSIKKWRRWWIPIYRRLTSSSWKIKNLEPIWRRVETSQKLTNQSVWPVTKAIRKILASGEIYKAIKEIGKEFLFRNGQGAPNACVYLLMSDQRKEFPLAAK